MMYKAPKSQKESGRIEWWTLDGSAGVTILSLREISTYWWHSVAVVVEDDQLLDDNPTSQVLPPVMTDPTVNCQLYH